MKRTILVATVLGTLAIGGAAWWAVAGGRGAACKDAGACDPASRGTGAVAAVATKPTGKVLGRFDPAMAGCRFACATRGKVDAKSVVAQPGARDGQLTRCPVSGVVFTVDAGRPHVGVGSDDFVTCCDTCAEKLRKQPRRFVRA